MDEELIEELLKLTGRNCVITGSETFDIIHIEHRGAGGDPTKNTLDNIIPGRKDFHDVYDGRRDSLEWNGMNITDLEFETWEPRNGNLSVKVQLDGEEWRTLEEDELWFYKRPTQVKAEEAWQHHQMVLEGKKDIGRGIIKMGAGLTPIKQNEEWRSMGYSSWKDYCGSPEVSIGTRKADRAVKIYDSLVKKIGVEPDRLVGTDQLKLEEITKVVDEDNVDRWLADAQNLGRDDLRKEVREALDEPLNVSCSNCIQPAPFEFDVDFDKIAFGSRSFRYCPYKPTDNQGYLIETLTPKEQRELASSCKHYEEE